MNDVPPFDCELDLSKTFEQRTNATEVGFAALLRLTFLFLGCNKAI